MRRYTWTVLSIFVIHVAIVVSTIQPSFGADDSFAAVLDRCASERKAIEKDIYYLRAMSETILGAFYTKNKEAMDPQIALNYATTLQDEAYVFLETTEHKVRQLKEKCARLSIPDTDVQRTAQRAATAEEQVIEADSKLLCWIRARLDLNRDIFIAVRRALKGKNPTK